MIRTTKIVSIFILLILSCEPAETPENFLAIPPEMDESQDLSSLVQQVHFRPLVGELYFLPYEADKVDFSDQLIVIGDFTFSQSAYVFEKETGKALEIPLKKGEGPMEVRGVNDFWLDSNFLYVLDGIGRKIVPIKYSGSTFEQIDPIQLEVPLRRFAKTKLGFVGLTGGGNENALVFLDENGKLISEHFPSTIAFLMSPLNPFHKVFYQGENLSLFHSPFDPTLFQVGNGTLVEFSTFQYEGFPLKKPQKTDFQMDQEGFTRFRVTLKDQPSFFTLFEYTSEQLILLYFIRDQPRLALADRGIGHSFILDNLKNDISYDQPFPKVIGVTSTGFLAMVNTDQINREDPSFANSLLNQALQTYPEAQIFLLEFQLKMD